MRQHTVFHNRPGANSMNKLLNILDICSLFPFNDLYLPTYQLSPVGDCMGLPQQDELLQRIH